MQSIIEEIYYNVSQNLDNKQLGKNYSDAQTKAIELYKYLEKRLNEKQKEILDKIAWAEADQQGEACCAYFKEGFKLGFLIAVECLTK